MTEEHGAPDEPGTTREFSIIRKGFDPVEVEKYLTEYDEAFCDLEEYAARLKRELKEARRQITRLQAAEQESIDNAMLAVFDAKDRIIEAAMQRAQEIEEQARGRAGLSPRESEATPSAAAGEEPERSTQAELLDELAAVVGNDLEDSVQPNDVLHKMLEEAETIRTRLDSGLAAAFDQMEQMQRDAEGRAEDLLVSARLEAERLRAAAAATDGTEIEVSLTDDGRPSRYSRNSAGLPRIGVDGDDSVLAKMNSLRSRMREADDDADRDVAPSHDAAG